MSENKIEGYPKALKYLISSKHTCTVKYNWQQMENQKEEDKKN